jgi:prepilin-type N-terminal cleavage/methylation domain-containing protein
MKKNGFTLIELVAVVTILSVLATTAMTQINNYTAKAKASADVTSAKIIQGAVQRAMADGKISPPSGAIIVEGQDCCANVSSSATLAADQAWFTALLDGGYMNNIPDIKVLTAANRSWIIQIFNTGQVYIAVTNDGNYNTSPVIFPSPTNYSGALFDNPVYSKYKLLK